MRLSINYFAVGHVRPPAGSRFSENEIARTTAAGVSGELREGAADQDARVTAAAPAGPQSHVPFYKKRKFIISQAILIPLGIVLLFVLLVCNFLSSKPILSLSFR